MVLLNNRQPACPIKNDVSITYQKHLLALSKVAQMEYLFISLLINL